MAQIKPFAQGEVLGASHLNQLVDAFNGESEGVATGETSGGLEVVQIGRRRVLRARRPLEGWFKITGSPTGSAYPATQQVEQSGGTWANGPRTTTVRETTGSTSVPANSIVRAWKDGTGRSWWFTYAAC